MVVVDLEPVFEIELLTEAISSSMALRRGIEGALYGA